MHVFDYINYLVFLIMSEIFLAFFGFYRKPNFIENKIIYKVPENLK